MLAPGWSDVLEALALHRVSVRHSEKEKQGQCRGPGQGLCMRPGLEWNRLSQTKGPSFLVLPLYR